eukprot:CAMPEP_0195525848 /NCGR_PEP_ID=MMETSP0794_2-20130614/26508_1 /TAXON_ID=515487 /ORGANISM="Stephanopyxis turris, Strain CCMP 815" /LENGTH=457 /DNA_ID=CAMNT_0040656397 /DNA_START=100 /DNA_END=1473 /DNA_ORIENTATION=+
MKSNKLWYSLLAFILLTSNEEVIGESRSNLRHGENDVDSGGIERQTSLLSAFKDPRHVDFKDKIEARLNPFPLDLDNNPRPYKILSFGGSVTWGTKVTNRHEQTYPKMIGSPYFEHVDNFAIRATGANYPSLCLQSILQHHGNLREDESYDIILVEFALNESHGLPRLMHRLRDRYPDAVIVFVELWSLMEDAMEYGTERSVSDLGMDPSIDWVWRKKVRKGTDIEGLQNFVKEDIGGYVYRFPRPKKPSYVIEHGWVSSDNWRHMSEVGHAAVASDLTRFLSQIDMVEKVRYTPKRVGTWSNGDQCYNWFSGGVIPPPPEFFYEGASGLTNILSEEDGNDEKWLLSFESEGVFKFTSKFPESVPLGLGYMSCQDPPIYPLVEIIVNGADPIIINPNENDSLIAKTANVVIYRDIGRAQPGENTIIIKPMMEEGKGPFRVAGVYMCGVCGRSIQQTD